MSRLGQLYRLKRCSELLIPLAGTSTRRNLLDSSRALYVIQIGEKRNFSALTPVLCCKSPDGAGPSPPPTGGSGKDGDNNKKDNQRTCPKCGHPILVDINQYIKANRFVRCENCDHMFTVVGENDANKGRNSKAYPGSGVEAAEAGRSQNANTARKPPPPPRKIYEFLDKYIVGQNQAKKMSKCGCV